MDTSSADDELFAAARDGDAGRLAEQLERRPEKLHARTRPYESSLLHLAAAGGHLEAVDLLLARGLDVNTRDTGDNAYAMHFAAGGGHLEVVRRLADAGGDVVGRGDDHALEVIGWATCFGACHREVAELLVARGARHHIFSAVSMALAEEVRSLVTADPNVVASRLSRNEEHRTPLHQAVLMGLPEMAALLLDLGADPLAVDGSGHSAVACASSPLADRPVLERIHAGAVARPDPWSERVRRREGALDFVAALALGDVATARARLRAEPDLLALGCGGRSALHLMAKRGDAAAAAWLLERGADPNARWWHWEAELTPLHLAASRGHLEVVRRLLAAGADPTVRDSRHDGDALDWARHFEHSPIVAVLERNHERAEGSGDA